MSIATGYVTIALMVGGRLVFQHLGWAVAAFITPAVLMLFGGAFFAFSLSGSASTASWAVFAGAITQVRPAHRHIKRHCLQCKNLIRVSSLSYDNNGRHVRPRLMLLMFNSAFFAFLLSSFASTAA